MTPTDPKHSQEQAPQQQSLHHTVAVIGERLLGLISRFEDHVVSDNKFQDQMFSSQLETRKTLQEIKETMAGWKGSVIAATAAVSAVWAVVVLALTLLKG